MLAKFVAAVIIGTITACIGPFYYCKKVREQCVFRSKDDGKSEKCSDKNESLESESPFIHIKITHPYQNEFTDKSTSDASENVQNPVDSREIKETKQVVQDIGQVSTEESRIIPYKTSRNQNRMSTRIWSSALRGKLDRIKSSSTELCGTTKVVRAQVEPNPQLSSSHETSAIHGHSCIHSNSSRLTSSQSNLNVERARKRASVAVKKWRNLKRTLICSSSEKTMLQKEANTSKKQRLSVPVGKPNRSPSRLSMTLQKNRLVDVSTSTRLSVNVQNDETTPKNVNMDNSVETSTSRESQKEVQRCSSTEALQEIASLIKRQSINGTSICDVKISGLMMNQADLINLFQATNQTRTPSIIAAEEASIVSIKFHRERNNTRNTSYYECPLTKFYRRLPELFEDLSFSEMFKSQELEKRATPAIHVSRYSDTMNNSRNETSYIDLPRFRNGLMTEESMLARQRTLSRRFNTR